ncbi:TrgA family protein [Wenxinia saemankumensis]|uniref:Tellurium resistance protein n=1 Tax=Wenxinia saemankumensis TaxID=1447782 RepID=A0A1M6AU94_9RHOB|nr:TrgA family protein [Wenxinia saemankumensis]SHI40099.1 hypothetical protein SAMN05444417_0629 [Wenxinia saemankumensis]
MPTAARLSGAVTFLILAFLATQAMLPLFPENAAPRNFLAVNLGAAAIAGWVTVGSRAGRGYIPAFGLGVTGLSVFLFWMLLVHGFDEMLANAFRKYYDGPVEALVAMVGEMIDLGTRVLVADTVVLLFVGSILAALVTEYFGRNYR